MRVVRNVGYIKRRQRAAKLMVGLGLLVLLGSWAVYLTNSSIFLFAMIGLVFGFIFFNGGMQQIARWSRRPRADLAIDSELQRLNDRYTLIHFPQIPGRRPDHVLVTPQGPLVFTSREAVGRMSVNGRRWRKRSNPLGLLFSFGGPQLGNPTIENEEQVKGLQEFMTSESLPGEPFGAVVFVADNVEVEIVDSPIPVLHVTELYDHVRSIPANITLSGGDRDRLAEGLARGEELERSAAAPPRPKKKVRAA
jgi:hypothetical protein